MGGVLVDRLVSEGIAVRVAGRRTEVFDYRWPELEAVAMDVLDRGAVERATSGIDTAYYLIHSMAEGERGFEERDRVAAMNFGAAALSNGVRRVVYLGGLGRDTDELSPHLSSRQETGRILAEHGPQVLELRASMVLGWGSASFRMMLDLVKRLPVMVTPRWVQTRSQPIAIDDAIHYLSAARAVEVPEQHRVVEIGGADVLSFADMLRRTAKLLGRPGIAILPVPVLTPRLSSLWCGLVTSIPVSIARPLIDGLCAETVVRETSAAQMFPDIHPMGFDEAVRLALR